MDISAYSFLGFLSFKDLTLGGLLPSLVASCLCNSLGFGKWEFMLNKLSGRVISEEGKTEYKIQYFIMCSSPWNSFPLPCRLTDVVSTPRPCSALSMDCLLIMLPWNDRPVLPSANSSCLFKDFALHCCSVTQLLPAWQLKSIKSCIFNSSTNTFIHWQMRGAFNNLEVWCVCFFLILLSYSLVMGDRNVFWFLSPDKKGI